MELALTALQAGLSVLIYEKRVKPKNRSSCSGLVSERRTSESMSLDKCRFHIFLLSNFEGRTIIF